MRALFKGNTSYYSGHALKSRYTRYIVDGQAFNSLQKSLQTRYISIQHEDHEGHKAGKEDIREADHLICSSRASC